MIPEQDCRELSDFSRNPANHLRRLARSGHAEVLTVNGQAKGVIMATKTFDRLVIEAELARSLVMLDASMKDVAAGRTKPAKQAFGDIARRVRADARR